MTDSSGAVRVLHVDDEPDFADLTRTFLEREDDRIHVDTAQGPEEGLDRLADIDFDCVVSDYDMPGRNGIEFLRAVRAEYPSLPFILFTGKGSEEVASDAISAGATDYLQKGAGTEQYELLANRIENAVSQARGSRAERHLRELTEATEHIFYVFTQDWSELLFINSAYEDIWGQSVETLRDDPSDFLAGVHPDDRDRVREAMDQMSAGETVEIEYRVNPAEHYERWVRVRGTPIKDESGAVTRVAGFATDITEKKHQQQNLKKYKQLVDSLPDPVAIYDPEGHYELVNQALADLREATSAELIGEPSPHIQRVRDEHEDDPIQTLLDGDRDVIEGAYTAEFSSGDRRTFEYLLNPLDVGENVQGIVGSTREITERKHRERELERYEQLVENLPAGVFRTTLDGEIVSMNSALQDIYDAESRVQLRNAGSQALYVDNADREQLLHRLEQTGQVENKRLEVKTLDGNRRSVRATITRVEEDGTRYLDGIVQDVTDRHRLERELEQVETIAKALNDPVYVIDEDGRFTYVNDAFVDLVGYSEETIVGNTPALIKDEDEVERAERQLGRLLSDEGPNTTTFEVMIQPKEGAPIVCEDHMGVLPYEGDSFDGSVGILREITERKRRERELRRERDRLDEFAGVVSHDLRNPLNLASIRLELAAEECDSPHLEDVAAAHDRMKRLIEDLLTFAHAGTEAIDDRTVDLQELLEECWERVECPDGTLVSETEQTLQADRDRLGQLLENLFVNAVDHGGTGVTVRVGDCAEGFYVEDDGPGIPEDERESVFDAGYSSTQEGTGFGLSIVEQVAEAHGWDVRATDGNAGGARFEITGVTSAE